MTIPLRISRYEVRRELGRGGMATVYLAYDPNVRREVAVKVLPRQFLHDPTFRTRFSREAETIAMLEHPAIVPIYDFGEDLGQPFLVMRYMPGGSLAGRLEEGPLPPADSLTILQRICSALDRAHAQGIVHRDLKPANILFDQYGDAFLTDFGIVKVASETTSALTGSNIVGTPAYMSPEQAQGLSVDGRSDIYTLGTILFQSLTGRLPFISETPMGMAVKHITEPIPDVRELNPALPADFSTIIQRAMAKQPADRYATAGEMARALAALQTTPSIPPPLPLTSPPPRPAALQNQPTVAETAPAGGLPLWVWAIGALAALLFLVIIVAGGAFAVSRMVNATPTPPMLLVEVPTQPGEELAAEPEPAGDEEPAGEASAASPLSTPTPALAATATLPPLALATIDPAALDPLTLANAADIAELSRLGQGSLNEVAYSPDAGRYAVAGGLGVWIYDTVDGTLLAHLDGHEETVRDVDWSPDGDRLVSASDDGRLIIWDTATGTAGQRLSGHEDWARTVDWSPDGARLASGGHDNTVRIWDAASGAELAQFTAHDTWVRTVAWSPAGDRLASGDIDHRILLWDTESDQPLQEFSGHTGPVYHVSWSPDGTQLASAAGDGTVRVWSAADGSEQAVLSGHLGEVYSVVWSPDGTRLLSAGQDATIRLWNPAGGAEDAPPEEAYSEEASWDGADSMILALDSSADGSQVLAGAEDGTVRIWNVGNRSLAGIRYTHTGPVNSLSWSSAGPQLAFAGDDRLVQIWSPFIAQRERLLSGATNWVRDVAYDPAGERLAAIDFNGRLRIWEANLGRELAAFSHRNVGESVAWSPDGNQLASAGRGGAVRLWDPEDGSELQALPVPANANSVAYSPDGDLLAAGLADGLVLVWALPAGEELASLLHTAPVQAVSWSPDGQLFASGSDNGLISLWDTATWQRADSLTGHSGPVNSLDWTADGSLLASGSSDRTLRVWDVVNADLVTMLTGHRFAVWAVEWSADDTVLASGSGDGTVILWGIPNH